MLNIDLTIIDGENVESVGKTDEVSEKPTPRQENRCLEYRLLRGEAEIALEVAP